MRQVTVALALLSITTASYAAEPVVALSPEAQKALLASKDPQLAANKKLVWDMWRTFLQGGDIDSADRFLAPEYHQHNPNAETGLAGVKAYFRAQGRKAEPPKKTEDLRRPAPEAKKGPPPPVMPTRKEKVVVKKKK